MELKAETIIILILGSFFCACSKTHQTTPEPVVDPPAIIREKPTVDVRNLHAVQSLGFLTSGSTQYVSKLKFDNWSLDPNVKPDLGMIIPKGKAVSLITIGGGLSAGAQNGGLFRDGQLSAYPNLVAKQLGISDFKTPLFDETHANGTGFTLNNPDKSETFFKVENNLGTAREYEKGKPLEFTPYVGKVNNFSAPWLSTFQIINSTWSEQFIGKSEYANGMSWPQFLPYATRFIPAEYFAAGTFVEYITESQPYNVFILEDATESFLNLVRLKGPRVIGLSDLIWDIQNGDDLTRMAIEYFKKNGSNGIVFTVPHYKYLGISTWNTNVLNQQEIAIYEQGADIVNKKILEWAQSNDLAVVDLNDLYKRVAEGKVKIGKNGSVSRMFDGNFFSSDGIYPSTLGQAFVANEVIKAINIKFKSNIKPVNIENYLMSIGFSY